MFYFSKKLSFLEDYKKYPPPQKKPNSQNTYVFLRDPLGPALGGLEVAPAVSNGNLGLE